MRLNFLFFSGFVFRRVFLARVLVAITRGEGREKRTKKLKKTKNDFGIFNLKKERENTQF